MLLIFGLFWLVCSASVFSSTSAYDPDEALERCPDSKSYCYHHSGNLVAIDDDSIYGYVGKLSGVSPSQSDYYLYEFVDSNGGTLDQISYSYWSSEGKWCLYSLMYPLSGKLCQSVPSWFAVWSPLNFPAIGEGVATLKLNDELVESILFEVKEHLLSRVSPIHQGALFSTSNVEFTVNLSHVLDGTALYGEHVVFTITETINGSQDFGLRATPTSPITTQPLVVSTDLDGNATVYLASGRKSGTAAISVTSTLSPNTHVVFSVDVMEEPQCNDGGVDNDKDGFADYPLDRECTSLDDFWETDEYFLDPSEEEGEEDCFDIEGNPCHPGSGSKTQTEIDVALPYGLNFVRYYNSADHGEVSGGVGRKWRHSYQGYLDGGAPIFDHVDLDSDRSSRYPSPEQACVNGWLEVKASAFQGRLGSATAAYDGAEGCEITDNGVVVANLNVLKNSGASFSESLEKHTVRRPNGSRYTFQWDSGTNAWQHIHGKPVTLLKDDKGTPETDDDIWVFTATDGTVEEYDQQGLMVATVPIGGYRIALSYNSTSNLLETISGPFGRTLALHYDAEGRVDYLVRPDNEIVDYTYGDPQAPENLTQVTYPDNSTRTYHYEEENFSSHLSGISDETGARYATWDYDDDNGKVIGSKHAGEAEKVEFVYNSDGSVSVTTTVRIDDPDTTTIDETLTNTRTYHYAVKGGANRVSEVTGDRCITCPAGRIQSRTYYDNGQLETTSDWKGNETRYTYYANGRLATVTRVLDANTEQRTTTTWDNDHPLPDTVTLTTINLTDPQNPVETVERIVDYDYYPTTDGYPSSRIHKITLCDPGPDNFCDSSDEQRTTVYSYDANGRPEEIDGPLIDDGSDPNYINDLTRYAYDSQGKGNLVSITNALDQVTLFPEAHYDSNGRPKRMIDANNVVTDLAYDLRGRLTHHYRQIDGDTANPIFDTPSLFDYKDNGLLQHITQPDGSILTYEYDDAQRLTHIIDGAGNRTEYQRDRMGNPLFERVYEYLGIDNQEIRALSAWRYDALGQLEEQITYKEIDGTPDEVVTYGYDANGNRDTVETTTQTDTGLETYTSTYGFDALDRMIQQQQDPLGYVTSFGYNPFGDIESVTTPRGNETVTPTDDFMTHYTYNALGDLLVETSPDRGEIEYQYDSAGNPRKKIFDRTGTDSAVVEYRYDALNRLTAIDYAGNDIDVAFHYDETPAEGRAYGIGRLTGMDDATGSTGYDYDILGRLTTKTHTALDGTETVLRYGYDAADRVISITYPSSYTVVYHRNTLGEVESITLGKEGEASQTLVDLIEYEPFGPARAWSYGNGIEADEGHDASYRVKSLVYQPADPLETAVLSLSYGYDDLGNIEAIIDNTGSGLSQSFQYDPLSRLTSADGSYGVQEFDYDANGNREIFTQDLAAETLLYSLANDHLEQVGTEIRDYDDAGNTLSRNIGSESLTYDDRNRLVSAIVGATTTEYQYNGIGERMIKTTNEVSRHYYYGSDGELLMERDADGQTMREYVYLDGKPIAFYDVQLTSMAIEPAGCGGESIAITDLTVPNGDTLLCQASLEITAGNGGALTGFNVESGGEAIMQAATVRLLPDTRINAGGTLQITTGGALPQVESEYLVSEETIYYIHPDHLATPRAITDQSGSVVWRWDSDPFGTSIPTSTGLVFNLRFPGQYYDEETGLHYNYFRDYDPSTGRYVESDPIGLLGGFNSYTYVHSNPLKGYDINGLQTAVVLNGVTDSNPFGHTAIATTGNGVYSYGNSTELGSNLSDYIDREASRRNTDVIILNTTEAQESKINEYLKNTKDDLPPWYFGVIPDPFDTCASRTRKALEAGNMLDPYTLGPSFPTDVAAHAEFWRQAIGGKKYNIPKGANSFPSELREFDRHNNAAP